MENLDLNTLYFVLDELQKEVDKFEELDFSISKIARINAVLEFRIKIQQLILNQLQS